jgi:hypothetical protein
LAIYFTFFYFGILQPKYWATLIVLTWNRVLYSHVTLKSEAIACARRCRSSRWTGWWTRN